MKNQNYLLILLAIVTLNGCIPPLYHASVSNAPMFSKKGELNATGAHGKTGTDIQASYSISNKSAIMLNGSFGSKILTDIDSGSALTTNSNTRKVGTINNEYKDGYRFNFVEGGYGLFLSPKNGSDFRAEIFGLIGTGYAVSFNELINYKAYGKYMRYSIQSDLGFVGKITEGALSLRIGYLDFSRLHLTESSDINSNSSAINPPAGKTNSVGRTSTFFIDPAVTFRFGYKGVKAFLQSGMSFPLSGQLKFGWDRSWGSIGVQIRINTGK